MHLKDKLDWIFVLVVMNIIQCMNSFPISMQKLRNRYLLTFTNVCNLPGIDRELGIHKMP